MFWQAPMQKPKLQIPLAQALLEVQGVPLGHLPQSDSHTGSPSPTPQNSNGSVQVSSPQ